MNSKTREFTHFDKRPTSRSEEDFLRSSALHELRSFRHPVNLSCVKVKDDCPTFHLAFAYLMRAFEHVWRTTPLRFELSIKVVNSLQRFFHPERVDELVLTNFLAGLKGNIECSTMMDLNFWTVFLTYVWSQQEKNSKEELYRLPYWENLVDQLTKENTGESSGVVIVESNGLEHAGKYRFFCTPRGISVEHNPDHNGPSFVSVPAKNNKKFTPSPSWEKYCKSFGYH